MEMTDTKTQYMDYVCNIYSFFLQLYLVIECRWKWLIPRPSTWIMFAIFTLSFYNYICL